LISRKDIGSEQAIVGGRTSSGAGFGALECARGRLYHLARVGADGRIAAYGILAPTDWNFHPAGPYVAELLGARIGRGEAARSAAKKMAALMDPCIGFEVEVKEFADA
jgi:Ni,Fe-hydrogenase I large subunit